VDESLAAIDAGVRELLAERLHVESVDVPADVDASLMGMGLDSTAILSLVTGLEDRYDVEIPDRDITLDNFGSVGAVSRYMAGLLP
jgi:acyl carrier protein